MYQLQCSGSLRNMAAARLVGLSLAPPGLAALPLFGLTMMLLGGVAGLRAGAARRSNLHARCVQCEASQHA
eukprot:scaffold93040_cov78-Phaeocystis_antarctica.AAC.1